MTIRERIADFISGGEIKAERRNVKGLSIALDAAWASNKERQSRLDRIAAQETPGANATVRRMARIARGEA